MALAMAGILAPITDAALFVETTDYSNDGFAPTSLGAFNPASDAILGTLSPADFQDAILVTGTPGAAVSLPFSFQGTAFPGLGFQIYDNAGFGGFIAGGNYDPASGSGNQTFNFLVPADGNYMMSVSNEGLGSTSYTIGTVPEPSASLLLTAVVGVSATLRRRKDAPQKR